MRTARCTTNLRRKPYAVHLPSLRRTSLLTLALIGALAADRLHAQSTNTPETLHVYSRIVSLDIVVTDNKGNIVSGLTKHDFTVLEDKQPQIIKHFESVQDHALLPMPDSSIVQSSADLKKIGNAPVAILVLDEMLTKFEDMAYSRECIERYLRQQQGVLSQPTEILVVRSDRFLVLKDFTQDRAALLAALQKYKPVNPKISGLGAGDGKRIIMALGALEQIAKSQIGTPGRKNIVWIGKGFPTIDPVGGTVAEPILESFETSLHMTINLLLRAHAALFVIDPAGLQGGGIANPTAQSDDSLSANDPSVAASASLSSGADAAPDQSEFTFASLAPLTGGAFLFNRNNIDGQITKSLDEGTHYYTLSYVPNTDSTTAAQYRHIRVQVHRPGLSVQTRQGYYPPEAVAPVKLNPTRQQIASTEEKISLSDLIDAASNRLAYTAIAIEKPTTADRSNYHLRVKASDLEWKPRDGDAFEADTALFVVSFSPQGKVTGRDYLEVHKTTATPPMPASAAEVIYDLQFKASPNSARLRFVVRDMNSSKIGTADLNLP